MFVFLVDHQFTMHKFQNRFLFYLFLTLKLSRWTFNLIQLIVLPTANFSWFINTFDCFLFSSFKSQHRNVFKSVAIFTYCTSKWKHLKNAQSFDILHVKSIKCFLSNFCNVPNLQFHKLFVQTYSFLLLQLNLITRHLYHKNT